MTKTLKSYEGEVTCRGFAYHLEEAEIEMLAKSLPVSAKIKAEPDNEYDSNAIKVFVKRFGHVAYVAKPVNIPLKRFLDKKPLVKKCRLMSLDLSTCEAKLYLELEAEL